MKSFLISPTTEARLLRYGVLLLLFVLLQAVVALAQEKKEVQIFEVRKNLQMTSKDPIIRDYYVNAGENSGLKVGAYILVYRKVPLADPYKQDTQAHVEVPVGTMRVIFSDRTMAIGRVHSIRPPENSPVLDNEIFMVGDRLDMGTISFEKQSQSSPKDEATESTKESKREQPAERKSASNSEKTQEPVDVISR